MYDVRQHTRSRDVPCDTILEATGNGGSTNLNRWYVTRCERNPGRREQGKPWRGPPTQAAPISIYASLGFADAHFTAKKQIVNRKSVRSGYLPCELVVLFIQSTRRHRHCRGGEVGVTQGLRIVLSCSVQPSRVHEREKPTTRLQRELPAHFRVYSCTLLHRETCSLARVWTGYESASSRLDSIFFPSSSHLFSFSSKSSLRVLSRTRFR